MTNAMKIQFDEIIVHLTSSQAMKIWKMLENDFINLNFFI